ncbi:transmembrane protein 44 [Lates japonicus]|uniref:Transmembrane protein 44 n=1 Tax=Lates japonicus TaxID=270547 RepID=A0AAD3M8X9_LATJO|nr:transmembrane protein 44 [Lates japonicus]
MSGLPQKKSLSGKEEGDLQSVQVVLGFQVGVVREQANYGEEDRLGHRVPGSQDQGRGLTNSSAAWRRRPESPQQGEEEEMGYRLCRWRLALVARGAVWQGFLPCRLLMPSGAEIHLHRIIAARGWRCCCAPQ